MITSPPFGSLLRSLRQRAGLSQAAVADALDVSRQWIVAVEAGERVPSLQRVEQMHDIVARRVFGERMTPAQMDERTELLAQWTAAACDARVARWVGLLAAREAILREHAGNRCA